MRTEHHIIISNAQDMSSIKANSIDLVVTSPPYPMIEMWDEIMSSLNPEIAVAINNGNSRLAFSLMHKELDKVWKECYRVLKDGGFMCINIGDATRSINGKFELFNNHSQIIQSCLKIGFTNLPNIIWRKVTNSPNKFMGSGMLPCGAYVTLEHEWILIFRKGEKRSYLSDKEKSIRRQSSFFWEERNTWFSDVWDLTGVKQKINNSQSRDRNASFPLAIPYRLINMYSQIGDTILDPFGGLFTTTIAAMISERNSFGIEIDNLLLSTIQQNINSVKIDDINTFIRRRLENHLSFVKERIGQGKAVKYNNANMSCQVVTSQETEIAFHYILSKKCESENPLKYVCSYAENSDMDSIPVDTSISTLF